MRAINIGLDGRPLQGNLTGIGRYVFELLRELDALLPQARFFVYSDEAVNMPVRSERWRLRIDPFLLKRYMKKVFWLKSRCALLCARDELDVFWGAANFLPGPWLPPKLRTVLTVYDLNYKVVPETMTRAHRLAHALFFQRDVRRADLVFTISRGTSARLKHYTGRAADAVIYPAVDGRFRPLGRELVLPRLERYAVHSPYLLSVATWEPRKNLELLIHTFLAMKAEGLLPEHKLVLVGGRGWKDERLLALSSRHQGGILPLGYVPDEDLPALYAGADAFVFPSIYEGFGIPVLEARACGARIVTSDIPELREAGGPDAHYVKPDAPGLRAGLLAALASASPTPRHLPSWTEGARLLARLLTRER